MLADYYSRSALAAAQILAGFNEGSFRRLLSETPVGISLGRNALKGQGPHLADLLVRLMARLYPRLAIVGSGAEDLIGLAARINPKIDIEDDATVGVTVGDGDPFGAGLYAGSHDWLALLSSEKPQPIGTDVGNPFGAGASACLTAAALFRMVMLPDWTEPTLTVAFSSFSGSVDGQQGSQPPWKLGETVLAGAGAIGNGALWAAMRADISGTLHVVDPENLELSNLQRYVLAERADEGAVKADLFDQNSSSLKIVPHQRELADFLNEHGYRWPSMLLGLDSAEDRVSAQSSLPLWIANAWTQPGDLGVSVHPSFGNEGACVACMYLPDGKQKNEDELVAETLGVPHLQMQVRAFLYSNEGVDRGFLEEIANAAGLDLKLLLHFEGRSIRELYVEGFCGGEVIPVGQAGKLRNEAQEMHVPLPHQSALAGVLLAASAVARTPGESLDGIAHATRLDVLRPPGEFTRQPLRARRDGRCLCDDQDFVSAYDRKYRSS